MFENIERTSLEELGEFGLIDHLGRHARQVNSATVKGIGDDAAVVQVDGRYMLLSTDMLIEQVHFDLVYTPLKHLGYKAVVVNLSDIYAMNGTPTQITVSMALSSKFTLDAVEELYAGINLACEKYGVDLVGGDTSSSHRGLYLSLSALGTVDPDKVVYRSGAKPGELLCVTGDLGGAYMGLQVLEREKRVFLEHPEMQPDLETHAYIVGRQLRPEARKDIVEFFAQNGIVPGSMIDVSDGLSSEILHLSKHSGVDFVIYEDKLPIDQDAYQLAIDFGIDPLTAMLNGGEDYELLFTLDQKYFDLVKNNPDITVIGYARESGMHNQVISKSGNAHDLIAQGWKAL
ncbi:MAG: thiamine-phosphate kinase [Flavobacteriales bacterium]|nr:thiamine-phosphate kinase [Flavobacteriales bacterium]